MCSDGFSTEALPQKIDGNAFQATFGSGVLNEMIKAATPTGRRTVSTVRCAIDAVVVRPYERRPSPATKRPISTAASVSPARGRQRLAGLLGDDLRGLLASARAGARRSRGRRRLARPGFGAAQSGWAARAAATAIGDVIRARASDAAERRAVRWSSLVEPRTVDSLARSPVYDVLRVDHHRDHNGSGNALALRPHHPIRGCRRPRQTPRKVGTLQCRGDPRKVWRVR